MNLKTRIRKMTADLKEQQELIRKLQERVLDSLGADGFFV